MASTPPATSPQRDAWTGIALLTLVSFFNYLDRMVLPAVAQPIKEEFGLSDAEVGLLTGFAFVLLYAFAGIPIGRLADRSNRRTLLAAAVAFWSLATAACGIAKSFIHLLLARMSVGVGEAACQPLGYALIADYFPPQKRATALGFFMVGNSLGIMAGFGLGGWLGGEYGWRTAFLVVGLPGLLLALAIRLLMREPPRRGIEGFAGQDHPGLIAAFRVLLANRAYVAIIAANIAYAMMIFGPIAWLPAFFIRSHDLGMGVVGVWTGFGIGVGMAVGMLVGGPWADRLVRVGAERPLLLCMAASLFASAAYAVAFWASNSVIAFAATFVAAAVSALCAPTNVAALQNVCDPRLRATASAILQIATSLVGIGLAPFLIGALSDALAPWAGADSLRYALTIALLSCFLAAGAYAYAAATVRRAATSEVGFSDLRTLERERKAGIS
jgi:predicted MFS family arabinose efflux permease